MFLLYNKYQNSVVIVDWSCSSIGRSFPLILIVTNSFDTISV